MKIEIERRSGVDLPLLERLPGYRLARMEGYNGIGKSLTVRLLQLAVGRQTFHRLRTWETFRDGLGEVRIRVSDLDGAAEVVWNIDAGKLPPEPTDVSEEWFEITVDGKPARLSDAASLLSVHRLPGDTGLAETLGEQIQADRRTFTQWHRLFTEEGGALSQTLDLLDRVHALVGRIDPSQVVTARDAAIGASTALERRREELRVAVARQGIGARARALSERLAEFATYGADVDAQAAKAEADLTAIQSERAVLNAALVDLESAAARSEEARKRMKQVRKRLETHFAHLAAARLQEDNLLQRARIPDADEAATALERARRELLGLVERRAALDASPLMHGLLSELRGTLERGETVGLGPQILLGNDDSSEVLTVTALRKRFDRREQELVGVEPSAEGQALAETIESVSNQIQALEQLPAARTEIDRRLRLMATAEAEIQELVEQADSDVIAEVDEKRDQLARLDERAAALARERTMLAIRKEALGGGRTPGEIEAEYRALLQELSTDEKGLEAETARQDEAVRRLQSAYEQARGQATAAREVMVALEEDLRRVVHTLADDESLAWLASVHALPRSDHDTDSQLSALAKINSSVANALERAGAVQGQTAAIEVALDQLASRLRGQAEGGARRYSEEVTQGYGVEFRGWFDDRLVREALMPEAKRILAVDLRSDRLDVEWETKSGGRRARPLDAFSRGEQAFAYTRARLASLDASETRARNRLIVLDEFGAFIARDRLQALVEILKERQSRFPTDQVLLILPIAADYREQMKTAIAREKERLEPIVRALDQEGFFAVEL